MEGGKSFNVFPLRAVYRRTDTGPVPMIRIAVSVPKRLFKRAVDRNLLKRRIREAFRLNIRPLPSSAHSVKGLHVLLIYTGKEEASFDLIQSKIILILRRLHTIHEQDSVNDTVGPPDSV